MQIYEARLS